MKKFTFDYEDSESSVFLVFNARDDGFVLAHYLVEDIRLPLVSRFLPHPDEQQRMTIEDAAKRVDRSCFNPIAAVADAKSDAAVRIECGVAKYSAATNKTVYPKGEIVYQFPLNQGDFCDQTWWIMGLVRDAKATDQNLGASS